MATFPETYVRRFINDLAIDKYLYATLVVTIAGNGPSGATVEIIPWIIATGDDNYYDINGISRNPTGVLNNGPLQLSKGSYAMAFMDNLWVSNNSSSISSNLASIISSPLYWDITGDDNQIVNCELYDIHLDIYIADHSPTSSSDYISHVTKYVPATYSTSASPSFGSPPGTIISTPEDNNTLFQNITNAWDGDSSTFAKIGSDSAIRTTPTGHSYGMQVTFNNWVPA